MAKKFSGGTPLSTPFKMLENAPISDDQVVETYQDLTQDKYKGSLVFAENEDTLYLKKSTGWKAVGDAEPIEDHDYKQIVDDTILF